MKHKITIFVIQENVTVNSPIVTAISKVIDCQILAYANIKELKQAIKYSSPNLLIIDPDFSDKSVKEKILKLIGFNFPSIVVSKEDDKAFAIDLLKKGAVDYICKTEDNLLAKLQYSVKEIHNVIQLRLNLFIEQEKKKKNFRIAMVLSASVLFIVLLVLGFFNILKFSLEGV